MEYDKGICPVVNVDGILATGKQFDLDITLPCDDRSVKIVMVTQLTMLLLN